MASEFCVYDYNTVIFTIAKANFRERGVAFGTALNALHVEKVNKMFAYLL